MPWIILIVVLVLVAAVIGMYNTLVSAKNKVDNSWSQIEVQLQRRFDLIPNLVDTIKGYMTHENEVLTKVTELRSSWTQANTVGEKANLDNQLSGALKSILSVTENYPELKANENFTKLQEELTETEDKISYSRQFYNDSVTIYNTKLELFPTNLIGSMFGFSKKELFKVDSQEARQNVKVDFNK